MKGSRAVKGTGVKENTYMEKGSIMKKIANAEKTISVNKTKVVLFLLALTMLFVMLGIEAGAEERSIYIGDIIELKITTQDFTADELIDRFSDFEVIDIMEQDEGFFLKLRTFETGVKTIPLGDKMVIIDVRSTLDEIQSDDILEGAVAPEEPGFAIKWRYLFFALLTAFIVIAVVYLVRHPRKEKRTAAIDPWKRFIWQTDSISIDDGEYFAKLTLGLKEYLEEVCSFKVKGKTSAEILMITAGSPGLEGIRTKLGNWLYDCDRIKYTGASVSDERKKEMRNELTEMVKRIEAVKEQRYD